MGNLTFRDLLSLPRMDTDAGYSDYISSAVHHGAFASPMYGVCDLYEDSIFKDITVGLLVDDYTDCRGTDIFVLSYLGKDACFVRAAGRGWEYCDSKIIDTVTFDAMLSYIINIMLKQQMGDIEEEVSVGLDEPATHFLNYYGAQWGLKDDNKFLERIG